jgi:hypothetical protein
MLIYFSSTFLVPGGDLFLSDEWRHGEGLRQYRHVPARTEALRCKEAKPRCGARGVEKVSNLSRVTPAPFFSTPLLFQLVRRLPAREITELDKQPTPPLGPPAGPGRRRKVGPPSVSSFAVWYIRVSVGSRGMDWPVE